MSNVNRATNPERTARAYLDLEHVAPRKTRPARSYLNRESYLSPIRALIDYIAQRSCFITSTSNIVFLRYSIAAMPSRNSKSARSTREISRRSTARRASRSSQDSSRHTSTDITIPDTEPTGPARRRSPRFTLRQHYTQRTDTEDARMTEEDLHADVSHRAIPNIYNTPRRPALKRSKVSARSAVVDLIEETPTADDAHP